MLIFATLVHVLLCVFMIFVILLQPGKDAGMGAAFGGGAATSAFGGRGAVTFLSKVTAVCAGLFFLTSLGLSFVGMSGSVAARVPPPASAPPSSAAPQTMETLPEGATPVEPETAAPPGATETASPNETPPAQPAQRSDESGGAASPGQPARGETPR
jgi:preprotein translocase subunit SecG